MMRDNSVYDQLERVIHSAIDPYLEGYGGSQVPKLVNSILSAFEVKPIIKKHRPCSSCGSQFRIFTTEKKDEWLFICDNEGTCCEVISMRIKAKTPENAWLVWDKAIYLHSDNNSNNIVLEITPAPKTIKETLRKAMDRAEQKAQEENVGPWPNCGKRPQDTAGVVPPKGTKLYFQYVSPPVKVPPDAAWNDVRRMKRGVMITEYSMKLKDAAKALVDKLNLIEKDGRCASVFICAANRGLNYSGPNYNQELKDLENVLNESLCS